MKGFQLIFRDLKMMWHHKHGRIALIFLILVPLIYAGFFLAGYWNPYGRLDRLPVAVVNLDKGAAMDDKPIHAGKDFIKSLKKSKDLDFQFVSEKEANKGIKNGSYYMTLTIPKDFSQKVTTLMDSHPQPAKLIYEINPGKNFVASQISKTATEQMRTKLANSITKSYADSVFSKFRDLANGLSDAGNGAAKINQGTVTAKNGTVKLSDGLQQLNNGSAKLQEGSSQLMTGQQRLNKGMDSLKTGAQSLGNGMSQLANGQAALEKGMEHVVSGTQSLSIGNQKLVQGQAGIDKTANT